MYNHLSKVCVCVCVREHTEYSVSYKNITTSIYKGMVRVRRNGLPFNWPACGSGGAFATFIIFVLSSLFSSFKALTRSSKELA